MPQCSRISQPVLHSFTTPWPSLLPQPTSLAQSLNSPQPAASSFTEDYSTIDVMKAAPVARIQAAIDMKHAESQSQL